MPAKQEPLTHHGCSCAVQATRFKKTKITESAAPFSPKWFMENLMQKLQETVDVVLYNEN